VISSGGDGSIDWQEDGWSPRGTGGGILPRGVAFPFSLGYVLGRARVMFFVSILPGNDWRERMEFSAAGSVVLLLCCLCCVSVSSGDG
jgi:hypothetical protein